MSLPKNINIFIKEQSGSAQTHDTHSETVSAVKDSGKSALNSKLNWLRAGVLGANDGIVSTAGLVVGVAGASVAGFALFASGVAGLVAGALSMAAGEYVSVSTQRDTEKALIAQQKQLIESDPAGAESRLTDFIRAQGVSESLARLTAQELSAQDAVAAHTQYELGIVPNELTNPWHAALASMIAFACGAFIPLLTIVLSPPFFAVPLTIIAVSTALALTGTISAFLGNAPILRATVRNIVWGNSAMLITYLIGAFVGGSIV